MAIRTVVTRGFGNGTFNGTIGLVVTRGYLGEVSILGSVALVLSGDRIVAYTLGKRDIGLTVSGHRDIDHILSERDVGMTVHPDRLIDYTLPGE